MNERDFSANRAARAQGQAPFAAVLGCADSRVAPELATLQPLLDQLLAKDAQDRFAGATEAAQAIEAARERWLQRAG